MKKAILFFLFTHFIITGQAQNSVYPDMPFTKLFMIDVAGDNIYTAGGCDIIMLSEDGGSNWVTLEESTYGLEEIKVVPNTNGEKAFYLYRSSIYVMDMATKTLEDVSDDNLNSLSDNFKILYTKGDSIYIIDDVGIFKARIGEYSWEKSMGFSFTEGFIMRADQTDNFLWLGMSNGKVLKVDLTDQSMTETYQFDGRVFTVEMVNDDIGYFTYQGGSQIYKTTDSGNTFFPLNGMPETSDPVAYGENLLMTINTNRIYVSMDGGVSSQYIGMPDDGFTSLNNGYVLTPDTTLYLVGISGMVLKTEDLGQNFEHLNPFPRESLQSITLNQNGEGYAVGGKRHVVHTTDGGETWNFVDWNIEDNYYQSVVAAGPQRFLVGSDKGILIIENNTIINTIPGSCYLLYNSPISNDIYAVKYDSGLTLSKSSDNGDSWTDLSPLSNYAYNLFQSPSGRLYTINSDLKLIVTEDEGANWEVLPLQGLSGSVRDFYFLDDENGIISAGNALYRTTDGGNTVTQLVSIYGIDNLYMFSNDHFIYTYATNDWTTIQETTDGGQSWDNTGFFCTSSLNSFYDGDETIWYAQKGGHINKHTILSPSAISQPNKVEPLMLYPNPVKSGGDIFLPSGFENGNNLTIYDITGKRLVSTWKHDKSNKIKISNLAPGTYIVEVLRENGERQLGKFIICQ